MCRNTTYPALTGYALITGASSGIGLEYAHQLATAGYNLLIVSNEKDKLKEVEAKLKQQYKTDVISLFRDLGKPDAAQDLFDYCENNRLRIDVLINNAGIFIFNDVINTDVNRIQLLINLHITTATILCRLFGEKMKERNTGYILNMSSLSAWMPMPGISLYNASKIYLRSFSRSFNQELKGSGVSVTVVCPGAIATDLYGLNSNYQQLGIKLGVIMTTQQVVNISLKGLFQRKELLIPGIINRIFIPLLTILPNSFVLFVKKKLSKYER